MSARHGSAEYWDTSVYQGHYRFNPFRQDVYLHVLFLKNVIKSLLLYSKSHYKHYNQPNPNFPFVIWSEDPANTFKKDKRKVFFTVFIDSALAKDPKLDFLLWFQAEKLRKWFYCYLTNSLYYKQKQKLVSTKMWEKYTQAMPQSRSTALPKHQKKERWGTNNDKTNVIYETTDVRGTATEELPWHDQ